MKTAKKSLTQGLGASMVYTLAIVVLAWASSLSVSAQETWTGATSGTWSLSSNWSGGIPAPTDTATFNNNVNTTVDLGASGASTTVKNITFDTAGVGAFTIGATASGTLALATGGIIQTTSSVANIETINAPITLAGGYTFSSNSAIAADTLNFGGTIRSLAANTITLAGSNTGTNTISGAISGSATTALSKTGAGTWVLSGANTYTGATSVSGGTLILNANTGSLTSGNAISLSGGAFVYTASDGVAHTPVFGGISSTAGANTFEADETGSGSVTGTIGNLTRSTGNTLNIVTTGSTVLADSVAITLSQGIFYNGSDFATNGGVAGGTIRGINYGVDANSFIFTTSGTTVNGGGAGVAYLVTGAVTTFNFGGANSSTLKIATSGNVTASANGWVSGIIATGGHTDTFTGTGLKIGNSGDLVINTVAANDKVILNGVLASFNPTTVNALTKTGAGVLVLAAANTYSGATTINSGIVQVTNAAGLGFGLETASTSYVVGTTTVNTGATLDLSASSGGMAVNEPIVLNNAILTNSGTGTATIDNGIAGVQFGNLGAGTGITGVTVSFSGGGAGSGATATATMTGTGVLSGFTLATAGTGYTGATSVAITPTGGTETTAPTGTVILSSVSLNGVNSVAGTGNLAINAVVSGTGGLSKTGTNTLTLAGANTYSGGTTVSSGNLVVSNTSGSATGSGALTLNNGATLAGAGAINSTTNTINGVVQAGFSGASTATTGNLTLTATSGTTFGSTTNLAFNIDAATAGQGTQLNVGSSSLVFPGAGMTLTANLINSNTSVVTSPTSYILFAGTSSSQYTGLTTDGNGHITNLILSLTGTMADGSLASSYYSQSYLFLGGAGNGDLEIMVVPEPGTWVLMLGGLALLLGYQRARRSKI